MPRNNPCVSCSANVNSLSEKPLCQECRVKARTRACAYCGDDYANRDPNRMTCSPAHGAAYGKWARYGWLPGRIMELIREFEPGMMNSSARTSTVE